MDENILKRFKFTIEDTETGEIRELNLDGFVLGKAIKDEDSEIDYTIEYDGVNKGDIAFLSKMLDVEITALLLEDMGII